MDKWDKRKSIEGEWEEVEVGEDKDKEITQEKRSEIVDQRELIVIDKEHQRFYDKLRNKIEGFLRKQTGNKADSASKYILLAPDMFVLFARLLQDKRVSIKSKAIAGAVVAYFVSPIDIIPEMFTGPLGFLDDIILASYALSRILNDTDKSVVLEHWNGESDLLESVQEVLKKAEELVDKKVLGAIRSFLNKK